MRRSSMAVLVSFFLAAAPIRYLTSCFAGPVFTARASVAGQIGSASDAVQVNEQQAFPVDANLTFQITAPSDNLSSGVAQARAMRGHVGASSSVLLASGNLIPGGVSQAIAEIAIDDAVVSPIAATHGSLLSTAISLKLDGRFELAKLSAIPFQDSVQITASIADGSKFLLSETGTFTISGSSSGGTAQATGLLGGVVPSPGTNAFVFDKVFKLPVTVPTGIPLSIRLSIETVVSGGAIAGQLFSSQAAFENSFGFVTDRPVLDLPAGFTLNSAQGQIVDNRFVVTAASTPEPSSLALFGVGGMLLLFWSRTRIARRSSTV